MTILFADLCLLFDRISAIPPVKAGSSTTSKQSSTPLDILTLWLSHLQSPSPAQGLIIFQLLFPEHDSKRRYGLKEMKLAKELQKALSFTDTRLDQWDGDAFSASYDELARRGSGCFGEAVEMALQFRREHSLVTSPSLPIETVSALLDELASHCPFSHSSIRATSSSALGKSSGRGIRTQSAILSDLFSPLSPQEAKYLTQIVLRDLHPLFYPQPTGNTERALREYNNSSYVELELRDALGAWHWVLPIVWRYKNDLDLVYAVLDEEKIESEASYTPHERKELLKRLCQPSVGTLVEIPKAMKGRSIRDALASLGVRDGTVDNSATGGSVRDERIWCETKYDGERMQVHIDLRKSQEEDRLRIWSKSKRDSTDERKGMHPIIRSSLRLPLCSSSPPTPHLAHRASRATTSTHPPSSYDPVTSIIIEGEMVCYNESLEEIDEFTYVNECSVAARASGSTSLPSGHAGGTASHVCGQKGEQDLLESSQTTQSTAGQRGDDSGYSQSAEPPVDERHLAVVWFDILMLNGRNLMLEPYEARRAILENVVLPIPGYSMLTARTSVSLCQPYPSIFSSLLSTFSRSIVALHEGLMLKLSSSTYTDARWVKLKKDYIPGLGDSASFAIVGAGWNKERGRELRVGKGCWTDWYVGVLENGRDIENGLGSKPHYHVLFSVSHLASREMLLKANNLGRLRGGLSREAFLNRRTNASHAFSLTFSPVLEHGPPSFIFSHPLVFELYGAGFTRPRGTSHYTLRFPRVSALHESRMVEECVTLEELQKMGKEANSWWEEEAEERVERIWSRSSSMASGEEEEVEAEGWRERKERLWREKLAEVDDMRGRKVTTMKRKAESRVLVRKSCKQLRPTSGTVPASIITSATASDVAVPPRKRSGKPQADPVRMALLTPALHPTVPRTIPRLESHRPVSLDPPLTSNATIVTSSRSASFVIFEERIDSLSLSLSSDAEVCDERLEDCLWTIYPPSCKACIPLGKDVSGLSYVRRVNSLSTLLHQAGLVLRDTGSEESSRSCVLQQAIVFTAPEKAGELVREIRETWYREPNKLNATQAKVLVCSTAALAASDGPLTAILQDASEWVLAVI